MDPLYKNIKTLREKLDMSKAELARRTGYESRSTINKIEAGGIDLTTTKIALFAKALGTTPEYLINKHDEPLTDEEINSLDICATLDEYHYGKCFPIKLLGRIVAGNPSQAFEDSLGKIYYECSYAERLSYFALKVKGDSMSPRILDGDTVIVRKQSTVDDGEIAVVMVKRNDATIKQVRISEQGITLVGFNTAVYQPHFYTNDDIENLPVEILGRVMESRAKF